MAHRRDEPYWTRDGEEFIEPTSVFLSEDWEILDDDFLDLDDGQDIPLGPWDDALDE